MTATPLAAAEPKPGIAIELSEAERFLACLDPVAKFFTFQTFDDNSERKDPKLVKVLHGTLAEHAAKLQRLNDKGAGIFVTANETDGKGRKADNVVRIRTLFVDLDGSPLDPVLASQPPPHVVSETSPGRWHCYWRITNLPLEQFRDMQKALAARFGGDPSVHDLPRVMRLPGFVHRKGEPFASHIVSVREGVCAAADFPATSEFLRQHAGAGVVKEPPSESRLLNNEALQKLSAWVPVLFGSAAVLNKSSGGYRVSSKALGRKLQEDLSISPQGIKDFGVHDLGDPHSGGRTAIDLVMEHRKVEFQAAADWLHERLGHNRNKPQRAAPTPKLESLLKSAAVLRTKTFVPLRWIVPQYLPEGLTILGGKPKIGKSWQALDMATAVASGGKTKLGSK